MGEILEAITISLSLIYKTKVNADGLLQQIDLLYLLLDETIGFRMLGKGVSSCRVPGLRRLPSSAGGRRGRLNGRSDPEKERMELSLRCHTQDQISATLHYTTSQPTSESEQTIEKVEGKHERSMALIAAVRGSPGNELFPL
jgi:hypothetical protein